MNKLYNLLFYVLLSNFCFAQSFLDLKLIDELTNDSTSDYYYPELSKEFTYSPATIDQLKANYLYYGQLYKGDYRMFKGSAEERKFIELVTSGRYKKAILMGEKLMALNPVNLDMISRLNICYQNQNLITKLDSGIIRQSVLLNTILRSGTGNDIENAFRVVDISDEYIVMALVGVRGISRQSIFREGNTIDIWKVKEIKSGKKYDMHFSWLVNREKNLKNLKIPDY